MPGTKESIFLWMTCSIILPSRGVLGQPSAWSASRNLSRSYYSTVITTTTGRPCLATATGSARAKSISQPKPNFVSFALRVFMRLATNARSILAKLADDTIAAWRERGKRLWPVLPACRTRR